MKRFKLGEKIKVVDSDHELNGKTGRVDRLRNCDEGAWVTMDDSLPENLAVFPAGDDRRNNIVLYPEHCDPEPCAAGG